MNKKGLEGPSWTIIVWIILMIVLIVVVWNFLVKHREEGNIFNRLVNQTTGGQDISLKGVSEEVRKDPVHYLDSVLKNDPQRYIDICGGKGDPKKELSNDDINLLKEKDCEEVEKAKANLANVQTTNEEKADELYKQYKNGDVSALEKLRKDYPNSMAKKFAEVLASSNFDNEANNLCKDANVIISLVYCGDIYKTKAEKDPSKPLKYYGRSLFYYNAAMGLDWSKMTNDREKKFYVYSFYYASNAAEKLTNFKSYIDNYGKLRKKFNGDKTILRTYFPSGDLTLFERKVDEVTQDGIVNGYVNEVYVDPVLLEIQGKPGLSVVDFEKGVTKVTRGGQPTVISVNIGDSVVSDFSPPITLFIRALPYIDLGIFCDFRMSPVAIRATTEEFNKASLVSSSVDYCNKISLASRWLDRKNVQYKVTWE